MLTAQPPIPRENTEQELNELSSPDTEDSFNLLLKTKCQQENRVSIEKLKFLSALTGMSKNSSFHSKYEAIVQSPRIGQTSSSLTWLVTPKLTR